MALTRKTSVDQITIDEIGNVLVRTVNKVVDGSEIIAQSYNRYVLIPGQDVSDQPDNVRAVCSAVWTPKIVAAFKAELAK